MDNGWVFFFYPVFSWGLPMIPRVLSDLSLLFSNFSLVPVFVFTITPYTYLDTLGTPGTGYVLF